MTSSGKIVLVDDVEANLQLLSALLTREGYAVQTASDGSGGAGADRQRRCRTSSSPT